MNLAQVFREGEIAGKEYVAQLESPFSSREPDVLAFIPEANRFERLLKEAEELVARYPEAKNRPSLFGMTLGVKDIFHVVGFTTQAGSKLPAEELQGKEAASVMQLKNAGALIMGKTVTTEFAYFTLAQRATRTIPLTHQAVQAVGPPPPSARACATSPSEHKRSARSFVPPRFVARSDSSQRMNASPARASFRFRRHSITLDFLHKILRQQNELRVF